MRKIEGKIIGVIRECLDGRRPPGTYTLTGRDRVESTGDEVKYFLWNSGIFKVTKYIGHLKFEFSNNGYTTQTTHSRLKALVAEFIVPRNLKFSVRGGYIHGALAVDYTLYPAGIL